MKQLTIASVVSILCGMSLAAVSQQEVSLIWSGTTGTGTPGSGTIFVNAGDELTLDILVKDTGCEGFLGAAAGVSWDDVVLTGFNAMECPTPENPLGPGLCSDSSEKILTSVLPGVDETPGLAVGFEAINIVSTEPAFVCETMYLGRTQFIVESAASSELAVALRVGDGVIQPDFSITTPATVSAFIEPAPGC
ncbi:MAG: hypothetical protein NXI15_05490 [Gammaproteobacteria bacterium]|nr:hypothetical protein [Gammaproteobacteria bacterium]